MTSAGKPISMKIYSRLKQPRNCVLVGKLLLFEHSSKLLKVVGLSSGLKACFPSYLPFFSPIFNLFISRKKKTGIGTECNKNVNQLTDFTEEGTEFTALSSLVKTCATSSYVPGTEFGFGTWSGECSPGQYCLSWVLSFLFSCVYVLVWACSYMWVEVCKCTLKPEINIGYPINGVLSCFGDRDSHETWRLLIQLDWLVRISQGSSCFCQDCTGLLGTCCHSHLLLWVLGIWNHSFNMFLKSTLYVFVTNTLMT